jgi:DNA-binding MarR family transcriptional regulator
MRAEFFDKELFADPAWDILLELYDAEVTGHRTTVSACCAAANVPTTTALRYIATLSQRGFVHRRHDPLDARRIFLSLSMESSAAMRDFFDARAKLHE